MCSTTNKNTTLHLSECVCKPLTPNSIWCQLLKPLWPQYLNIPTEILYNKYPQISYHVINLNFHHRNHGKTRKKGRCPTRGFQFGPTEIQDPPVVDVFINSL